MKPINQEIEVYLDRTPASRGIAVHFVMRENNKTYLAKPIELEFKEINEGEIFPEPTMLFGHRFADQFLDNFAEALRRAGYKGKVIDPTKQIPRLEAHLQDMRKITFHKLGIKDD